MRSDLEIKFIFQSYENINKILTYLIALSDMGIKFLFEIYISNYKYVNKMHPS